MAKSKKNKRLKALAATAPAPPPQSSQAGRPRRIALWLLPFVLGVVSTVLTQRLTRLLDQPRIHLQHNFLIQERYTEASHTERFLVARNRDALNNCIATLSRWRVPPAVRTAEPHERLVLRILLTNTGRTAATDLRLVVALSPAVSGLTMDAAPIGAATMLEPAPLHGEPSSYVISAPLLATNAQLVATLTGVIDSSLHAQIATSGVTVRFVSLASREAGQSVPHSIPIEVLQAGYSESELKYGETFFHETLVAVRDTTGLLSDSAQRWHRPLPEAPMCRTHGRFDSVLPLPEGFLPDTL